MNTDPFRVWVGGWATWCSQGHPPIMMDWRWEQVIYKRVKMGVGTGEGGTQTGGLQTGMG